jgi:hypothetical protein
MIPREELSQDAATHPEWQMDPNGKHHHHGAA